MSTFINFLDILKPSLLSLLPALVVIWLGYRLGMVAYFKRKEHEKIIQRYLETGIDLISFNIDHALSVFRENWAHSLRLLKEFRGTAATGLPIRKESCHEKFLKYEDNSFSITPFYKVKSIVDDDIFWEACQLLFAFVGSAYDFFENDLRLAIEAYSNNDIQIPNPKQFHDKYTEEIWRLNKESEKFYVILKELQNIALHLETKPMVFRDLEGLKNSPEIKLSVAIMKNSFTNAIQFNEKKSEIKDEEDSKT
jgi:hypothetical protein